MQIQFIVTVTIDRRDENEQTVKQFEKTDGQAMSFYLKEKVLDSLKDAWQYNAQVTKARFQFIQR